MSVYLFLKSDFSGPQNEQIADDLADSTILKRTANVLAPGRNRRFPIGVGGSGSRKAV